jgi:hypothetical protein
MKRTTDEQAYSSLPLNGVIRDDERLTRSTSLLGNSLRRVPISNLILQCHPFWRNSLDNSCTFLILKTTRLNTSMSTVY